MSAMRVTPSQWWPVGQPRPRRTVRACDGPFGPPWAHPRAGGDHGGEPAVTMCHVGSSPRGRGPLPVPGGEIEHRGLIPARAGTTPVRRRAGRRGRAHPRAGGDHRPQRGERLRVRGSSPRGRGPRRVRDVRVDRAGLIPARAGTTIEWCGQASAVWAHPRAGGDHRQVPRETPPFRGSSPRGRGPRHRLILSDARQQAHPRAGGDHVRQQAGPFATTGSSPRGRGPPRRAPHVRGRPGLIPARAGTTRRERPQLALTWAHPRAGGDHWWSRPPDGHLRGSSPRGRGPLGGDGPAVDAGRLIPARAGTTEPGRGFRTGRRAHPRAGGDHGDVLDAWARHGGSSPRGRGPPTRRIPLCHADWLIPARAGTTRSRLDR